MRPHSKRVLAVLAAIGLTSASLTGCQPGQDSGATGTGAHATAAAEQAAPIAATDTGAATAPVTPPPAQDDDAQPALSQASPGTASEESPAPPQPEGPPSSGPPAAGQPTPASGSSAGHDQSQAQIEGWSIDFFDGFDTPLEQTQWERYGWGDPPVGHGAMGVMSQRNSFTRDGNLVIRTQYENGQWSAGGAGSKFVHTASYGRWEVRARFPQAKGIGYAFLLWPADEGWPPEIDFAEGRVNGPQVMGVYHWDPDNKQEHRFFDNHDMSGWHTYGVIVEPDLITFTLDGRPWGTIEHPSVTDKQMFIGFQTGAMDPTGWQSDTETVDGGIPGPLTPAVADIEIDYVAHYTRN